MPLAAGSRLVSADAYDVVTLVLPSSVTPVARACALPCAARGPFSHLRHDTSLGAPRRREHRPSPHSFCPRPASLGLIRNEPATTPTPSSRTRTATGGPCRRSPLGSPVGDEPADKAF